MFNKLGLAIALPVVVLGVAVFLIEPYVMTPARMDARLSEWVRNHPAEVYDAINTYVVLKNSPKPEDLKQNAAALTAATPTTLGAPMDRAAVVIVEFFDFNCVHCRAMESHIQAILEKHPNIILVARDFPVLGDSSITAAKIARAAANQGRYAGMREALLFPPADGFDEAAIKALCEKLGIDFDKLKTDIAAPQISQSIDADLALGRSLNVTGTPFFYLWSPAKETGIAVSGEFNAADMNQKLASLLE
jgi:protein-disulfide isomerase